MAEREDLGVSLVSGRKQLSEPADDQVADGHDEVHRGQNVSIGSSSLETYRRFISGTYREGPERSSPRCAMRSA